MDIVERLREWSANLQPNGPIRHEAAEEITKLREEMALRDGVINRIDDVYEEKLAAAELQIKTLREALHNCSNIENYSFLLHAHINAAPSTHTTTEHLDAYVREVIREGAEYAFNMSGINEGLTSCDEEVEEILRARKEKK